MSTPKFKVGDRVRRISDYWQTLAVGTEGVVCEVRNRHIRPEIKIEGNPYWFYDHQFELISPESELEEPQRNADAVKSISSEDELAELVRKANEGIKAVYRIIDDFPGQVVDQDGGSLGPLGVHRYTVCHFERGTALKIRPKPAFTPFTVGDGWKVELKGNTVSVGCQRMPAYDLKIALDNLCNKNFRDDYVAGSGSLVARRKGIRSDSNSGHYEISWEDADKILKALEAAGV